MTGDVVRRRANRGRFPGRGCLPPAPIVVAAGWLCTSLVAAPASAQRIAYTGSLAYSTGEYLFDQRSSAVVLNSGITASAGRFRIGVSLPIVWQNSGLVNLVGDTWIPTGGPDHGAIRGRMPGETVPTGKRRQGSRLNTVMPMTVDTVAAPSDWSVDVADPLFSGAAEIWSGWGVLRSIEVSGAVKPSIATIESGVGTGEWDWSAGASIALAAGRTLLFADASYWWNGDMPDLELVDGFGWGAAAGVPVGSRLSLLATVAGSQPVIRTVEAPLSASLAGAWSVGRRSLHAGFSVGLSESSPDFTVFAGWRVDLFDRGPVF